MNKEIILRTEKATKTFTGFGRSVKAVDQVDVEIAKGDFVTIMGASGSGKSSLLFLMSALERCDSGRVFYRDRQIDNAKASELAELRKRSFGFVFQGIHLVPYLSLRENVRIAALTAGTPADQADRQTTELMERFSLAEAQNGLPSRVSGGEAQRAAAARAMINKPEILFADEPIGALNHSAGMAILETLNQLNREGQTIIMVTHELTSACYGNRVLFLRDGSLQGELLFHDAEAPSFEDRRHKLVNWLEERGW